MGISGLHTHLHGYGVHHTFPGKEENITPVVVDGPALAYSLWRSNRLKEGECLLVADGQDGRLIYQGDYRKFKKFLIEYVHALQTTALFSIEGIYFDGYLPPHKNDIRQARAKVNLERVKRNTGSLLHHTPSPPFVVQLTQDILSRLNLPVLVTNEEEADMACARRVSEIARISGGDVYLLSLDSDFHCFDLGEQGHYLPLDSLIVSESSVTGTLYNFKVTQNKIDVNLVHLVALMGAEGSQDSFSRSASESIDLIKRGYLTKLVSTDELERVARQFSVAHHDHEHATADNKEKTQIRMYGRLAEAVQSGQMWLPQLLEDCTQSSAWHSGTKYRVAAYNVLLQNGKACLHEGMVEWIRRAETVSGKVVDMLSVTRPPVYMNKLDVFVECFKTLLDVYQKEGKSLTQTEYNALIVMFLGTYQGELVETSIRILHLVARWQAIVYSYTLFCQVESYTDYPIMSDMYDLQTFLKALQFLHEGHTLLSLVGGHEKEIEKITSHVPWTSAKSCRKRRKR